MPADDLTPAERSMRSTIAAHASWAHTTDRSARTAAARNAFDQRFLNEAGGDPVRAEHLRKAYFARLALKSATARRKDRQAVAAAKAAAAARAAERQMRADGGDAA